MAKPATKLSYAPPLISQEGGGKPTLTRIDSVQASTVCRETACENLAIASGYCRAHYIKNWKSIKHKEAILKDGKFAQYIRDLVSRYPDKYLEAIKRDLADDSAFSRVIAELNLDEASPDASGMDTGSVLDEYPLEDLGPEIEGTDPELE
jgi:hypothetical protein